MSIHLRKTYFRVRSEVQSVMATVRTRTDDAILTAIEKLVVLRVSLAMKSVNTSSGRDTKKNVLPVLDERDFSENIQRLQMTASSRINSNTALNMFDGICGNIRIEIVDLSVNEKNFDQHTHTHHRRCDRTNFLVKRRCRLEFLATESLSIQLYFSGTLPALNKFLEKFYIKWVQVIVYSTHHYLVTDEGSEQYISVVVEEKLRAKRTGVKFLAEIFLR